MRTPQQHYSIARAFPIATLSLVVLVSLLLAPRVEAQLNQIKTDHFFIYYESGSEGSARRVAEVAEEVFDPLAGLYNNYEDFSPIHVLLVDNVDLSNGAADYYQNLVIIWATNLDYELRGTHDWIKSVLTHELTHVMSLNAAKKKLPFNFGLFQFGKVGRKHDPDYVLALPYYHLNVPQWFSEGIAQFEDDVLGFDSWDSHRDMLLRMATLEGDLLSYNEMGIFNRDDYHGEMVYNQGYSVLLYVGRTFGKEKVAQMARNAGAIDFDGSVKKTLGIGALQLYDQWVRSLKEKYNTVAGGVQQASVREGEELIDEGFVDHFPAYSPDGSKLAYLSNKDEDYSITKVRIRDLNTGKSWTVDDRVDSRVRWSPDGAKLIYAKRRGNYSDVIVYDVATRKKRQISVNLRAKDPAMSPDGKQIAFVRNEDGTNNLGLMEADGSKVRYLTQNNDATQYYSPAWSPDGTRIVFSVFRGHDRDIATVDASAPTIPASKRRIAGADTVAFPDSVAFSDRLGFKPLVNSPADERDPVWSPDGKSIYFSSDTSYAAGQNRLFNINRYDIETGQIHQVTNVLGGAFAPSVSPDGRSLAYAGYHAANYSIYRISIEAGTSLPASVALADRDYRRIFKGKSLKEDYNVGQYSSRFAVSSIVPIVSFEPTFIGASLFPNQFSVGLQASAGDLLGSNQFAGSAVVGKNRKSKADINSEFEAFYQRNLRPVFAESRVLSPSFYAGVYNRNVHSFFKRGDDGVVDSASDTLGPMTIGARVDSTQVLPYTDVTILLNQALHVEDQFADGYTILYTGSQVQLSRRWSLTAEYVQRRYRESFFRKEWLSIDPRFFQNNQEITDELPRDPNLFPPDDKILDDYYYKDMRYFKSHEFGFMYEYFKLKPTIDASLNPSNGRVISFGYHRINSAVTDSLVPRKEAFTGDYIDTDGDGRLDTPQMRPVDSASDLEYPHMVDVGMNEFILSWHELVGLPIRRNTVWFWLLAAYRDKQLKDPVKDSGSFEGSYYWPLKYYMGGNTLLRAYPYFTLSGTKILYGRAMYTFPLIGRLGAKALNVNFDKVYGSVFAEAGGAWNFAEFDKSEIDKDDFLTDIGAEVRLQLFAFYRVPMIAFFRTTWALNADRAERLLRRSGDIGEHEQIDRKRYFFGVTFQ